MMPASPMMGGGFTPPLDVVTGATAAWSVARRIRTAYTDNCLDVRKSTNGVWQGAAVPVGFVNNLVNTSVIFSTMGTLTSLDVGHVTTLYDQVGARNATNSPATGATVPAVINGNAGIFTFFNGNLGMYTNGDDFLQFSSITLSGDYTVIFVATTESTESGTLIGGNDTANGHANTAFGIGSGFVSMIDRNTIASSTVSISPSQRKTITLVKSGTDEIIRMNGSNQTVNQSASTRNNTISQIFRRRTNASAYSYHTGFLIEAYVFPRALTASEYEFIETNCMNMFSAT